MFHFVIFIQQGVFVLGWWHTLGFRRL